MKRGIAIVATGLLSSVVAASAPNGLITVGNDGSGTYDYDNITDAVAAAGSFGSLIIVHPGTYAEGPIDFAGKSLALRSAGGPGVTFLEPASGSRVVTIDSGESFGTEIDGFTIRDGSTAGSGGGLLVANESRVVVSNCRFRDNAADARGGGIYVDLDSVALISDCDFERNQAGTTGGGMDLRPVGGCVVERCRFFGNTAVDSGGGAHLGSGGVLGEIDPPLLLNCSFSGNTVTGEDGDGGGATILVASAFVGMPPQEIGRGGAFGCVFVDNEADSLPAIAGGRSTGAALTVAVVNCIVRENLGNPTSAVWPEPSWFHCNVDFLDDEAADSATCITTNPRLIDRLGEDAVAGTGDELLRVEVGSPCIDAGYTYASASADLNGTLDLGGGTRVLDDPLTADTGFGGPPTVDIGAYEFDIDDFSGLNVCWWTGGGVAGDLGDTANWYEGLAAVSGRTWVVEDYVDVALDDLTTTIGPVRVGTGWLDLGAGGGLERTLRLAASNFPFFAPANLQVGGYDAFSFVSTTELVTLRARDVDVLDRGEFSPRGDVELNGTLTNLGETDLRSGTLTRIGTSTEPLLLNLGLLNLTGTVAATATVDGDFRQGGDLPDGGEGGGLLGLFVGDASNLLSVTGTATLSGGVDVNTEANLGSFSAGDTFTFLTADGGFGGTSFDFVVTRGAILSEGLFFIQQNVAALGGGGGESAELLVVSGASLLAGASETEGVGLTLQDLILADIDGDGFEDLVLSVDNGPGSAGQVVVLLNQGVTGGTWDGFEAYGAGAFAVSVGNQPRGLDVGYVVEDDGLSRLDVVVANYEDGTVTVLTNTSTAGSVALADTLGPIDSDPDFPTSSFPLDVCVKNLDLDAGGLSDILVTNERDGRVWAFQNTSSLLGSSVGNPKSSEPVKPITRFSPGRGGSGRDDDTTGSSSDDDGVSSGTTGTGLGVGITMVWSGYDTDAEPLDLAVGDFDGDGNADIATANSGGDSISILLGTGFATYAAAIPVALDLEYSQPISITAGDLDGDGDVDLTYVCTNVTSGERVTKILRNTLAAPGGSFGWVLEPAEDLSGQSPYLLRARDLDGDGADDVVTLTETTSFASGPVFGFAAPVSDDTDGCLGDFNGDGSVGGDDLARILGSWGTDDPEVELTGDTVIDGTDLATLLGAWGACSNGSFAD